MSPNPVLQNFLFYIVTAESERTGIMTFRILKKNLSRKKSINLILLLFIFLSVTFIAGSLNNFSIIQSGIDNFTEQSGLADFHIMTIEGSLDQDGKRMKQLRSFWISR